MSQSDKALFDTISDRYVKKDLTRTSRAARAHRLRQTLALLPVSDAKPRILEVGCGAGFSATYLKGLYARYVGVDYSARLIDLARRHNTGPDVEFVCAHLEELQTVERFDLVLMIGVLHHLTDPAAALAGLGRWLTPGGAVIVNEPQSANPLINSLRLLRKTLDPDYSREQREFSATELRMLFESSGLRDVRLRAQGLFSTPLAEVILRPDALFAPIARIAIGVDGWLERRLPRLLMPFAWNVVVAGRLGASMEHETPVDQQLRNEERC